MSTKAIEKGIFDMNHPLVSIAMPAYNCENTIARAIQSIRQQSFENWELIVIDDGSKDGSMNICNNIKDPRIRVIISDVNRGISFRLNQAVKLARGKYFARMDADDVSFPCRIEKQLDFLQQHPDIDLLATATILFRGDGNALGRLPVETRHEDICSRPWNGFHLPHPTWMGKIDWFRRQCYESFADGAEDQYLLLKNYKNSRFACLDEPLLAYYEGDRPLKKMLRARRIFAFTYIRYFATKGQYFMMIRTMTLILMKISADILYALGFSLARNRLNPLTEEEQAVWKKIW